MQAAGFGVHRLEQRTGAMLQRPANQNLEGSKAEGEGENKCDAAASREKRSEIRGGGIEGKEGCIEKWCHAAAPSDRIWGGKGRAEGEGEVV